MSQRGLGLLKIGLTVVLIHIISGLLTGCDFQSEVLDAQPSLCTCKTVPDFVDSVRLSVSEEVAEIVRLDGGIFSERNNSKVQQLVDEATFSSIQCFGSLANCTSNHNQLQKRLVMDLREFKGVVILSNHRQEAILPSMIKMIADD